MKAKGMLVAVCVIAATATAPAEAAGPPAVTRAASGQLKVTTLPTRDGVKNLPGFSSGLLQAARDTAARLGARAPASSASTVRGAAAASPNVPGEPEDPAANDGAPLILGQGDGRGDSFGSGLGMSRGTLGCGARNTDGNVRVNQDCTFRGQAEEIIKFNPADPNNLIAGMNDGRIGFNHCAFAWSTDAGRSWGDGTPPFWARLNVNPPDHTVAGGAPTLHTYDFASDPIVAVDSAGRTFFGCIVGDIFDFANGLLVTEGPDFAKGSFYNTVPSLASAFVVTEDNNTAIAHDKPFLTADFHPRSPFRDSVYVTWTVFNFTCGDTQDQYCSSKIYFSRSRDHGQTWSRPTLISGASPLCVFGDFFDPNESPSACDFDQGSDPIVRPNGDIVVVFNNGNTPSTVNQQLAVVSRDGGTTWSPPVRVGDDVATGEPQCDFGRGPEECIPGAFIRTNDFPRIAVNRENGNLYATWQDYRTGEFDIHLSASFDGGSTWHEALAPVNPDSRSRQSDHYFPAIDVSSRRERAENDDRRGDLVAVSYFRTDRVPGENATPVHAPPEPGVGTSSSDYRLAGGRSLGTPYAARRVSPRFGAPDKDAGFNGDYSGLTVVGRTAHPIWSDTRNPVPGTSPTLHDEDVFTDAVSIPEGRGGDDDD